MPNAHIGSQGRRAKSRMSGRWTSTRPMLSAKHIRTSAVERQSVNGCYVETETLPHDGVGLASDARVLPPQDGDAAIEPPDLDGSEIQKRVEERLGGSCGGRVVRGVVVRRPHYMSHHAREAKFISGHDGPPHYRQHTRFGEIHLIERRAETRSGPVGRSGCRAARS